MHYKVKWGGGGAGQTQPGSLSHKVCVWEETATSFETPVTKNVPQNTRNRPKGLKKHDS